MSSGRPPAPDDEAAPGGRGLAGADLRPLFRWLRGEPLGVDERRELEACERADVRRLQALGVTEAGLGTDVGRRLDELSASWPVVASLCGALDERVLLRALWWFWLPLASLLSRRSPRTPAAAVHGIVGPPGAGKSTLARLLAALLEGRGLKTLALSLDDFYLPADRWEEALARHPGLRWRGPPGTHDVGVLRQVVGDLREGRFTRVPRYDKSARDGRGDRSHWERAESIDVVLLEGWFVGLVPRRPDAVRSACARLGASRETIDLALETNRLLADYAAVWQHLDSLLLLRVTEEETVRRWRLDAERSRRRGGRGALSEREVTQFTEYLVRALPPQVHYQELASGSERRDLVMGLGADRMPLNLRPAGPQPTGREARSRR